MDFLCVCIRVPKCGSTSLANMLNVAFAARRTFYMPHTLNLDAAISRFQEARFARTRSRNLLKRYHTFSLKKAFEIIASRASDGDLINGGHIDFPSVRKSIRRKSKIITLLREPAARCRSEYEYCRNSYLRSSHLRRIDTSARCKAAGKYSFDGFLDFLLDWREGYGDVAASYMGWDGDQDLGAFHEENVFHSGTLEQSQKFENGLSEKMNMRIRMPHDNTGVSEERFTITRAQQEKIEHIYPRDFQLYEWQLAHA
ncbi:MAG: sulfotransferase family 2 domain-containing protein [Micropepsaceae bacterium]